MEFYYNEDTCAVEVHSKTGKNTADNLTLLSADLSPSWDLYFGRSKDVRPRAPYCTALVHLGKDEIVDITAFETEKQRDSALVGASMLTEWLPNYHLVTVHNLSRAENTDDNRFKLANQVVDSWDMHSLIEYACDRLAKEYKENHDEFETDWDHFFGEEDDNA